MIGINQVISVAFRALPHLAIAHPCVEEEVRRRSCYLGAVQYHYGNAGSKSPHSFLFSSSLVLTTALDHYHFVDNLLGDFVWLKGEEHFFPFLFGCFHYVPDLFVKVQFSCHQLIRQI